MKTTKLAILLSMIISVSLHAQELDQDFLDSLPDDLKEDLIQKNETKELSNIRNFETFEH